MQPVDKLVVDAVFPLLRTYRDVSIFLAEKNLCLFTFYECCSGYLAGVLCFVH